MYTPSVFPLTPTHWNRSMTLTSPLADRDASLLAPWAMPSAASQGRRHPEPAHRYRSVFQRDRDRITHCSAFRRLSHKTQVFTGELGDYHRSRLTHTLEVASIARTLARALRLNEDLVEALALMHDIGHPPFGHAGEDVLNQRLSEAGGFSHNQQALRIVERLEMRYPQFPGLNLSHEVLAGQAYRTGPKEAIQRLEEHGNSESSSPLLEVQVVDMADSIAYNAHDADDALELGLLTPTDLMEVPLWQEATDRVLGRYPAISPLELRRAVVHELIDADVNAVLEETQSRLVEYSVETLVEVFAAPPLVSLPAEQRTKRLGLQSFLFTRVYRHPDVLTHRRAATQELGALFDCYLDFPERLPSPYREVAEQDGLPRAVGDFVSSLTDRTARDAFHRLPA